MPVEVRLERRVRPHSCCSRPTASLRSARTAWLNDATAGEPVAIAFVSDRLTQVIAAGDRVFDALEFFRS